MPPAFPNFPRFRVRPSPQPSFIASRHPPESSSEARLLWSMLLQPRTTLAAAQNCFVGKYRHRRCHRISFIVVPFYTCPGDIASIFNVGNCPDTVRAIWNNRMLPISLFRSGQTSSGILRSSEILQPAIAKIFVRAISQSLTGKLMYASRSTDIIYIGKRAPRWINRAEFVPRIVARLPNFKLGTSGSCQSVQSH